MADISSYLQKILDAIYGEEVRGSIHDALAAMNVESNNAMTFAATAQDSARASAALAKDSADTAVTKAGEVISSANAAKISENNAKASETIAIAKAGEASDSATAAKTSETNAANSEATVLAKAAEVEAAKNATAISEANTLAAEQRTKDIKSEVETLGAQATADKDAAEAARDAAKASQDAAAASAAGAAVSAGDAATAQNKAEDAQTAAEAAQAAAEAAKLAAEDSEKKAKTSETNAAKSASDASDSADTAKQYSGKSPKPIDGTWWTWNAANSQYEDTGISCELVGPTGNGIESITQKSGDHMPGSTDVYEIKMTDGTTKEISVYNGKNGSGIGDVQGIAFDIELPVGGWINGRVTIHDDRFIASARYKYFVDTYDECRDEVNESKIKPQDIAANGYMTFTTEYTPLITVTINVVRLEVNGSGETP